MSQSSPKPAPGPATGVATWTSRTAPSWIKQVAHQTPDRVIDTDHSEEKGTKRSVSVGDAIDVILSGSVKGVEGPYKHNGVDSVKVTFLKHYRNRSLRVVAAAAEGNLYVALVSLQNSWK